MEPKSKPNLPAITDDNSLSRYISAVQKIPILTATEEYDAAVQMRAGDRTAASRLVASHLRLVVSEAYNLRNYGIPVGDLIASGNLGLMQALQKFDPEKGFRFSTYAMFWIRAEMYETILNNWSIVRIGTSANQKRVFFNLSRAKRALGIMNNNLSADQTKQIAEYLDVPESDLDKMSLRMGARDLSLNAPAHMDDSSDALANLADATEHIELRMEKLEAKKLGHALLQKALADLPQRDREILVARRLSEPVRTLEDLSQHYGISRERIRQIEERAFAKLRSAVLQSTEQ